MPIVMLKYYNNVGLGLVGCRTVKLFCCSGASCGGTSSQSASSVVEVEVRSAEPHRVLGGEAGSSRGGLAGGDGALDRGGDGGLQLGDDQLDELGLVHSRLGGGTADHGGGGGLDAGGNHGSVVHSGQGTSPGSGDVPHHHEPFLHVPLLIVSIGTSGVGDGHQGSGGVHVAVGSLDVLTVPGFVLVQVGLGLLVGHLVLEVVLLGYVLLAVFFRL